MTVLPDFVFPACFPDSSGQVYLRGHMTLYPVPAVGGVLLAALPFTNLSWTDKKCGCTPEFNDVIASTTAIAFQTPGNPTIPEVCIIRLLIDEWIYADVNQDLYVNSLDTSNITMSPYYNRNPDPFKPSKCPEATPESCGRVDVNRDGRVNYLDVTAVVQSAFNGTHVPCGGIYATQFSCGSTRQAPLVPAVLISLDTIMYFSDDGQVTSGMPSMHQYGLRSSSFATVVDNILVEFDALQAKADHLAERMARTEELDLEQSRALQKLRNGSNDNSAERATHSLVVDIAFSVIAVVVCAAVLFAVQKRRLVVGQ